MLTTTVKVVALNNNYCNKKVGLKSTMLNWLGDCFLIASKFQLFNFCGLRIQIFSLTMSKLENECHTSSSSSFPSKKNLSFLQPFTAFLFKGRKTVVEALQSHGWGYEKWQHLF